MPLIKTCSIDALEKNIAAEIRSGKPREQAVAIARETLRDSCRESGKPVPVRKALEVIRKQPTTDMQTLILPKDRFKTREAAAEWAKEHDFAAGDIRETANSFRLQQRPAKDFGDGTFRTVDVDEGKGVKAVIGRTKQTVAKRERSREFLEGALKRARKILNPRDFAVIFQAARASAGGQIAARNRRDRLTAAERQHVEKTPLGAMSKAELMDLSQTLNKAYERAEKLGNSTKLVLSRAESLRQELRRRGLAIPEGAVYVALSKRGKRDVRKGFVNGEAEGGFHAHGLDRRSSKTLGDGGHAHLWVLPGTGQIVASNEDGSHQHAITEDLESTERDGAHSHTVFLPSGARAETKLGGSHGHGLMVETSGFGGGHSHTLVMPDGSELVSLTVGQFVASLQDMPVSEPLPLASPIARAMIELRAVQDATAADTPHLPPPLPRLEDAVEMVAKGETLVAPTFALSSDGGLVETRIDGEIIGPSHHVCPDSVEDIEKALERWADIERHTTPVPFSGPESAPLMFVGAAPNSLELARKEAIVGEDAITFQDLYLSPLGLGKADVAVGFAMPVVPHAELNAALCEKWSHHLVEAMKSYPQARVVALGRVAREVLSGAGVDFWSLPHPSAVRKRGNSGEVARKLRAISKSLDQIGSHVQDHGHQPTAPSKGDGTGNLADAISELRKTGLVRCTVAKSDEEKQIVYGVVLDPYDVDLQTEWVPPTEIESTAHGFLKKSRVIGFEHSERADAQLVESWVEAYPSPDDYRAAMDNQPHRAIVRQFGSDRVHSGAWIAGVELGDREWALYKKGELDAFSVGGFSFKTRVTTAAMPDVEFVEFKI